MCHWQVHWQGLIGGQGALDARFARALDLHTPQQISATAVTCRTDGGLLGVIRLAGDVVSHRDGLAERCTLPIARGDPSALIGADGQPLRVPR